jgi:hypothetical protein
MTMQFNYPTGHANGFVSWKASIGGDLTDVLFRFYFWRSGNPTKVTTICSFMTGAGVLASRLIMPTGGALRLQDSTQTGVGTTSTDLADNDWSRIDFSVSGISSGLGIMKANLYLGDKLESTIPTESISSVTPGSVGGPINEIQIGQSDDQNQSVAYSVNYADATLADVGPLGPIGTQGWGVDA